MKKSNEDSNGATIVATTDKKAAERIYVEDQLKHRRLTIQIAGITPLITNYFDPKSMEEFIASQNKDGAAKEKRRNRTEAVIKDEYERSKYPFSDGTGYGVPADGFKAAMVRGAKQSKMSMTDAKAMFHIVPDGYTLEGKSLVKIHGGEPFMHRTNVNQKGTPNLVFRACWNEWKCDVVIDYNANAISQEQLINLLNLAGFASGIGANRPSKSNGGNNGRFRVVSA